MALIRQKRLVKQVRLKAIEKYCLSQRIDFDIDLLKEE